MPPIPPPPPSSSNPGLMPPPDPYATLNVDPTASRDEIKSAYLSLARVLHPDKGGNEEIFNEVDKAWKILGDETNRAIYDEMGMQGVELAGQLVKSEAFRHFPRTRLGDRARRRTIREELRGLKEAEAEREFNVRVFVQADVGAEDLFRALTGEHKRRRRKRGEEEVDEATRVHYDNSRIAPTLMFLVCQQSVDFRLGESHLLTVSTITGTAPATTTPIGGKAVLGLFSLVHRYELDPFTAFTSEFGFPAVTSATPHLKLRGERKLTKYLQGEMSFNATSPEAVGMEVGLSRPLTETTHGSLAWGLGRSEGLRLVLRRTQIFDQTVRPPSEQEEGEEESGDERLRRQRSSTREGELMTFRGTRATALTASFSQRSGALAELSWLEKLSERLKVKLSLTLGLTPAANALELEATQRSLVVARTKFSFAIGVGARGLTATLRVLRGGTQINFPIHLTGNPTLWSVLGAGAVPAISHEIVYRLMRPLLVRAESRRRAGVIGAWVAARRRAAAHARMLRAGAEAKVATQKRLSGEARSEQLFVIRARYGADVVGRSSFPGSDLWVDPPVSRTADVNQEEEGQEEVERFMLATRNIDVTTQLNFILEVSGGPGGRGGASLRLPRRGTKADLLGFYDPSAVTSDPSTGELLPGPEPPRLFIRFCFAGRVYELVVSDEETLELPRDVPKAVYLGPYDESPVRWEDN